MGNKVATLRWRSGLLLFSALVGVLAVVMFVGLGVTPPDLTVPHHHSRGEGLIALLSLLDAGGVGWGFVAVSLYLSAWVALTLWRVVDPVALVASAEGLSFHPSLTRRGIAWAEIAEISMDPQKRGWWSRPSPTLALTFVIPQRFRFAMFAKTTFSFPAIDVGDGIADRFIAALPVVRDVSTDTAGRPA